MKIRDEIRSKTFLVVFFGVAFMVLYIIAVPFSFGTILILFGVSALIMINAEDENKQKAEEEKNNDY